MLNANYPSYYPASLLPALRQQAVQNTCKTGYLWDYSLGIGIKTTTQVMNYLRCRAATRCSRRRQDRQ